jgi:hypothetical protein
VMPLLTEWRSRRTECAGIADTTWPVIGQSTSMRMEATCRSAEGGFIRLPRPSIHGATSTGST